MKKLSAYLKIFISFFLLVSIIFGCDTIKKVANKENRLYFCESYDPDKGEINESSKFTTGTLTVMVDLRPEGKKIGVKEVNINITDKGSNEVVDTKPYTVSEDMDYIYFDGVEFEKPGKYRVSCLKKDGTVIVSGEVEIVEK